MGLKLEKFLEYAPIFVAETVKEVFELGMELGPFEIDHICFRVETLAQYENYKKEFAQVGALLSEALINGRPIATYKLHRPIELGPKRIPCVEIPAPKEGSPYSLGFEHIECVVPEALTRFIQKYPQLKFDARAIKNPINPEISLKVPSGKTVKFHNQSLEAVIAIEKKLR